MLDSGLKVVILHVGAYPIEIAPVSWRLVSFLPKPVPIYPDPYPSPVPA